jgi:hypothetical protein
VPEKDFPFSGDGEGEGGSIPLPNLIVFDLYLNFGGLSLPVDEFCLSTDRPRSLGVLFISKVI